MRWLKTYAEKCVNCGECMKVCSTTYFKKDDPKLARIKVTEKDGKQHLNACNQCGTCIAVCPTEALYRDKNGVVQVDKKKCTSCLMCVGFCPTLSMFFEASVQTEPFKCIACGLCAKKCPAGALELVNE
ncbi:4Fe-4S binding protein [Aminiphilus sp.]|uniref:4Fe-4S binding protein n=1 Tax=Aminiphilus sp. TaxID=1872488 RepID=UPI00260EB862|nr:4Fe-4S binding protein [Aminiphilus sp.]